MDGIDVGLSARTFEVWHDVLTDLGVDMASLASGSTDRTSLWAWGQEEVVQRFHPAILRRLAERALAAGEPAGEGQAWQTRGGDAAQWLELRDLLRALRAHTEIEECTLLVRRGTRRDREDGISGR